MKYILIVVILTIPVFVFLSDKRLPDRGIGTSEGYFQKKTSITVLGDENCKEKTQEALDLLREKSAGDYAAVMDTMGAIRCIQSGSLVFPWQSPPTFEVGEETLNSGSLWYASVLSHETCHIQQFFRKEQWQKSIVCINSMMSLYRLAQIRKYLITQKISLVQNGGKNLARR